MKTMTTILILMALVGCGRNAHTTTQDVGPAGPAGVAGPKGDTGNSGQNGIGAVFTTLAATASQCSTGGQVLVIASDTQGTGIYSALDADQQSLVTCNGATGQTGNVGATGPQGPVSQYSPITPIMPCGQNSSPWKEVLLCLQDGSILADFSETMAGQDTRLAFIPSGSYEDTDESSCLFNVSVDTHGNSTVSWGAGSNSYSTWTANSVTCTNNGE